MEDLRRRLIHLAHQHPEVRLPVLALLKEAGTSLAQKVDAQRMNVNRALIELDKLARGSEVDPQHAKKLDAAIAKLREGKKVLTDLEEELET